MLAWFFIKELLNFIYLPTLLTLTDFICPIHINILYVLHLLTSLQIFYSHNCALLYKIFAFALTHNFTQYDILQSFWWYSYFVSSLYFQCNFRNLFADAIWAKNIFSSDLHSRMSLFIACYSKKKPWVDLHLWKFPICKTT